MVNTPKRGHKSKKEQQRLKKVRRVKVVGDGRFVQRTAKPTLQGKKVKSQNLRVDANFAAWCRQQAQAEGNGSITEVTRKLYDKIKAAEGSALDRAVSND